MADDPQPLLSISGIANMLGIHPQTLRLYEREGFIKPSRTKGNTRRYTPQDVEQLRLILYLTREQRVNLAGVGIILQMQQKLTALKQEVDGLQTALAQHLRQQELPPRQQALMKASSRMLIKVP